MIQTCIKCAVPKEVNDENFYKTVRRNKINDRTIEYHRTCKTCAKRLGRERARLKSRTATAVSCELCDATDRKFVRDHIHGTNIDRGILCYPCNQGLGAFRDSIPLLEKAIAYLRKFQN